MRISDWSSDGCSSDLARPFVQKRIDLEEAGGSRAETIEFTGGVELDEVFVDERLQYPETSARAQARRARNRVDALTGMGGRKSVGKGKSVAGSGDSRGRRFNKKKK